MLSEPQRQTILELHAKGLSVRQIARTLGHARPTVRQVLAQGPARPPSNRPPAERSPALTSTLPALYCEAQGNVVRMQELLRERHGAEVPYSTLTYWVRALQLREEPPARVGHYDFAPGQEMQHDTSPHRLQVGGTSLTAQCAGLILGFSRYGFIQYYPRFTRFEAQVFLDAAFDLSRRDLRALYHRQHQRPGGRRQRAGGTDRRPDRAVRGALWGPVCAPCHRKSRPKGPCRATVSLRRAQLPARARLRRLAGHQRPGPRLV